MARKRSKVYKAGDKIQVSLNKNLSQKFLDWINMQSDLTNFFLYGIQELYKKTGHIDVIEVMPRKIDIDNIEPHVNHQTNQVETSEIKTSVSYQETENEIQEPQDEKETSWEVLEKTDFDGDLFS